MKNLFLTSCFFSLSFIGKTDKLGRHQISIAEAESILGEPAALESRENKTDSLVYITKSTFSAKR